MKSYTILGFDFSLNKPSCCLYYKNQFKFISWPKGLNDDLIELYKNSDIEIINRGNTEKEVSNMSIKARNEVKNSEYISTLIINSVEHYINEYTLIAFEGSSFGSKGDVVIQLSSRRYFLMNKLSKFTSLNHIFTYAPITIKKTANCSFKGSKKKDMIESFIKDGPDCKLRDNLIKNKSLFLKRGELTYKDHLDDLVDSYFILKTLNAKENLRLF